MTTGRATAIAISALGLAGCMVGPNYIPAPAPEAAGYPPMASTTAKDGQTFIVGGDVAGRWWTAFQSKPLDELVDEALVDNPNLAAEQAHLDAARETALAEEGALFPQVGFDNKDSYQKAPNGGLQSPLNNQKRYTYALFTPRLTVAYSPDIFGGVARRIESAQARAESEQFQLEAAYLTLTSNIVLAAVQEASLREQLAATNKVIQAQVKIVDLLQKEVVLGQVAQADVVQQEAALATSRQLLAPLDRQIALQRNALAALAGRLPSDAVRARFTLASLHLPRRLPVSVPSALVEQRPDVRAAAALVHQASADVGVAVANRLPNFALSGDVGQSAITLSRLANSGANFYSIAGTVSQPLFDAGTLYHRQRAAEALLEEAEARHKAVVLAAFQNVADALQALQFDAKAQAAAETAEKANFKSLDLMQKERVAGAANNLQILISQQAYLNALVTAAQTKAASYVDTAALFQALGGGWWNRSDVKPLKPNGDFFKFL